MFEFLQPNFLYLIIPIVGLVVFLYLNKKNIQNFVAYKDLKNIYKSSTVYLKFYYFIILAIFITSIIIIAQPIHRNIDEKIKKNGIDIMLVLDVSYSMKAEDLQPNRLQAAKQIITNFLDKQKNNRVWFVVFAWKPFTSLPLNFDYNISKKILDKISVDTINQRVSWLQWTAIWDGLIFAWDNFDDESREKVIILLTDGTANAWVNPQQAVEFLNNKYKNNKIKIYTIWIWKDEKTFVNIQNIMWFSQQVEIWWVDEEPLKYIAKMSWWKYYRADNNQALSNIFSEISELEKTEIEVDIIENIESKASYFTYILSLLLLLFFWIKARKHIYNR